MKPVSTVRCTGAFGDVGLIATASGLGAAPAFGALYQGHLAVWMGGGNNGHAQSENAFALDFHGSGAVGTLSMHIDAHGSTNDRSVQTANVQHVDISCS